MSNDHARFFHVAPGGPASVLLEEAEQYYLAGNLNEALAAAQDAWRKHAGDADVYRVLAYVHMARGEYSPATLAGHQAVTVAPDDPSSYATYAQVDVAFQQYQRAEATLALGLKRFPEAPALLALQADVRFRLGRTAEAVSGALRALELNPEDAYAKALLGTHYLKGKHWTGAAEMLVAAVAAFPQRADYHRDLGLAYSWLGEYGYATQVLARALELDLRDQEGRRHFVMSAWMLNPRTQTWGRMAMAGVRNPAAAAILGVMGLLLAVAGAIVLLVTGQLSAWAGGLLAPGIAAVLVTIPSTQIRGARGRRLDAMVERAKATLEEAESG